MGITVGMKGVAETLCEREDTAKEVGSGDLLVYATPCMVALMEGAACDAVAEGLEEGQTTVGTALNIKPILSVDGEGKLMVMAKVRGSRKALEYVLSRLSAEGKDLEGQTAIVAHADNPADAETLADLVRYTGLVKDVLISKIGPIIGTHTGAGMTALVFLK